MVTIPRALMHQLDAMPGELMLLELDVQTNVVAMRVWRADVSVAQSPGLIVERSAPVKR
jgi:antitoxin component of MazEF toxin-antitoxin module